MSQLRSDATQAIADAIQDTMMRKWTPLDEAAAYVLDALLDYLETHTEEWIASTIYAAGGHYDLEDVKVLLAALRVEP